MRNQLLSFFKDIFETIVIALAIFLIVYVFLVQPHRVQGDSMLPNFKNGELILTDKVSYKLGKPKRGDIIVFKAPQGRQKDFIKRIIALPGEKIKIENGKVFVNSQVLVENYLTLGTQTFVGLSITEDSEITVPQGRLIVFGDNRSHSSDSREFGTIDQKDIVGRAFVVYWPPQAFALVPEVKY